VGTEFERDHFYALAAHLQTVLRPAEVLTLLLQGESSEFIRLNQNRVRQAGRVRQMDLSVDLIQGQRHARATLDLSGNPEGDRAELDHTLDMLRAQLPHLPEDPFLHYAAQPHDTQQIRAGALPPAREVLELLGAAGPDLDLVGLWASGAQYVGFANSLGQRNWHAQPSFNLDWSVHLSPALAAKAHYAGSRWDAAMLEARMADLRHRLDALRRPVRRLERGHYRVYLAPAALNEILSLLGWGGFGLKSHRTRQTPLIKMIESGQTLDPRVTLVENHAGGLTPAFTAEGFIKPQRIVFESGRYRDCLVSARSAREYHVPVNADAEAPESLELSGGDITDIPGTLDEGLYISNLWYCNYSDRNDCRLTGMTRYACFEVRRGQIQAPFESMRFDESLYRMLGARLVGLSTERELLIDADTYRRRSYASARLPGALVEDFALTL